jgi:hypothetical protein
VLLVGFWLAWRPSGPSDAYGVTARGLLAEWSTRPRATFELAWRLLADGWVAVFMGSGAVGRVAYALLCALGLAALAGAARRAMANRIDGWYTLAAAAMILFWTMDADNTRRLFYPIVPIAMLQALDLALAGYRRTASRHASTLVPALVLAVPVVLALPALVLVGHRALDRQPIAPHSGQSLADSVSYYVTVDRGLARAEAAQDVAVLDGLAALRTDTPADARVMWMRPEYVAVLGARQGVPFYFDWDGARLAREIRERRVDYVIVSRAHKTDLDVHKGDVFVTLRDVPRYARDVLQLRNAVNGELEFSLMKVDPVALSRYLASAGPAR